MLYTNYRILNKADNSVLFNNARQACFSEFTNIHFGLEPENPALTYEKGRKMEVFNHFGMINIAVTEELVRFWIEGLNRSGFPMTVDIVDFSNSSVAKRGEEYPKGVKSEKNYVVTLDYDDYTCKAHIKIALHFLRYYYEDNMYLLIEEVWRYMQKYPDHCFWEAIQYCFVTIKGYLGGHHNFVKGCVKNIIPLSHLQEWFDKLKDEVYTNNEVLNLSNNMNVHKSGMGLLIDGKYPITATNVEEYKEEVNKLKEKHGIK